MANKRPVIAVGVDVGSHRTRAVILELQEDKLRFLGRGEMESRGWVKSRIADQKAISETIRWAVQVAECQAMQSIDAATIGMGGSGVDGASMRGLYEMGRRRAITANDLAYAIERGTNVRLEDDRMVLMVLPQDFTVDGRAGQVNPEGTPASRLEANVQVITASAHEHDSLVSAVHGAHVAAEETVFEAVAAAYASVGPEERENGVAVIDIGMHSTEIAIYDGEALIGSSSIAVGGDHFTRDLAWCLTASMEDAQGLKEEYGCCAPGLSNDDNLIEVPSGEGRPPREARRGQLNEILEARAEELFALVRNEIARAGMSRLLMEGAVLTGGGAMLPGMLDMAERVLECPARNGLPMSIAGWPQEILTPAWTTAAGLAMYSARLKIRQELRPRAPGLLNLVLR